MHIVLGSLLPLCMILARALPEVYTTKLQHSEKAFLMAPVAYPLFIILEK